MRQTLVSILSGGLALEGVVLGPEDDSRRHPAVVLCHPHPLFGGTMANAVVVAAGRALAEAGMWALLFNFRGVGGSEGEHAKGEREAEDIEAALEFLGAWPKADRRRMGLMGYSFGAAVALGDLHRTRAARGLALVAPSVPALQRANLAAERRPLLYVVGELDRIAPPERVREVVERATPSAEIVTIPQADHSLRGCEADVALAVADFFGRVLT